MSNNFYSILKSAKGNSPYVISFLQSLVYETSKVIGFHCKEKIVYGKRANSLDDQLRDLGKSMGCVDEAERCIENRKTPLNKKLSKVWVELFNKLKYNMRDKSKDKENQGGLEGLIIDPELFQGDSSESSMKFLADGDVLYGAEDEEGFYSLYSIPGFLERGQEGVEYSLYDTKVSINGEKYFLGEIIIDKNNTYIEAYKQNSGEVRTFRIIPSQDDNFFLSYNTTSQNSPQLIFSHSDLAYSLSNNKYHRNKDRPSSLDNTIVKIEGKNYLVEANSETNHISVYCGETGEIQEGKPLLNGEQITYKSGETLFSHWSNKGNHVLSKVQRHNESGLELKLIAGTKRNGAVYTLPINSDMIQEYQQNNSKEQVA